MNKTLMKANRTELGDETYTPFYAVSPLLEYLPKDKTIWCPFDKEWSAYVQLLKENGYNVIYSHKDKEEDFFKYEPENYDIIISNPPFSIKDKVLKRLTELNKPYFMLLPLSTLQGQKRFKDLQGTSVLIFDKRIGFHTRGNMKTTTESNYQATIYISKGLLTEKLIYKELIKYHRPLIEDLEETPHE